MKKIVNSWQFMLGIAMILDSCNPLIMKYIYNKTHVNLFESYFSFMLGGLFCILLVIIYTKKKKGLKIFKNINKGYLYSGLAGILVALGYFLFQDLANLIDISKMSVYISFVTPMAAIICLIVCKEKLTWNIVIGILLCVISIYCIV